VWWSKAIADLFFGLPPFGRVPSFGLRISDLGFQKKRFYCGSGFPALSLSKGSRDFTTLKIYRLLFTVHRLVLKTEHEIGIDDQ
jgi:hypothetical protein